MNNNNCFSASINGQRIWRWSDWGLIFGYYTPREVMRVLRMPRRDYLILRDEVTAAFAAVSRNVFSAHNALIQDMVSGVDIAGPTPLALEFARMREDRVEQELSAMEAELYAMEDW